MSLDLNPSTSDLHIRKEALDISRSFAVSAPAGSGKTSLLVQRILRLLAAAEKPEEILAITFTRKAAAEMRQRILEALREAAREASAGEPGEKAASMESEHQQSVRVDALRVLERDAEQSWNLLQNPERLRVQTIDGFCSYLTQRLCLETGTSHPGNLVESPRDYYLRAAEQLLGHISREDVLGEAVRHLVQHFEGNQDSLAALLADLLDSRANWLDLVLNPEFGPDQLLQNFRQLITEELLGLRRALVHTDISEIRALLEYSQANMPDKLGAEVIQFSDKAYCTPRFIQSWKALTDMLLTKDGKARNPKGINKRIGFPAASTGAAAADMLERIRAIVIQLADQPELLEQLNRVQVLPNLEPDIGQDDSQTKTLSSLAICLPILAAELKLAFANTGEADFAAISISALEALGEPDNPTRLNLRLDYRIRHILVDEFQDTSSLQVSLLERLMAGWEDGDGRSLFLVGDAMQSIYGFRKANVALFIRARELGIGATKPEVADLHTNFRSAPAIVDWVNQSFSSILPDRDDRTRSRVSYRHSNAQKPIDANSSIQLQAHLNGADEARQLASTIQGQLKDPECSIAILVRARSHLREIIPALKEQNIRWQAQKIEPLGQRMHVLDLHSLVRALHSPADRIAWLSILRSPALGLDMSDLYGIANSNKGSNTKSLSQSLWVNIQTSEANTNLSDEAKQRLQYFAALFASSQQQLGLQNLRDLVQSLWQKLGGEQSLFKASYQQDIDDYLALLESQSQGELIADLDAFESELERLYARPDSDTDCQLKIMTVHAAKGLEFDHVHLPQLQRAGGGQQRNPALVWQEREYQDGHTAFLAAARPARNNSDPIYDWLLADERERVRDESSRLLYVACTRAKKTLNLSGLVNWDERKETWKAPSSNSLMALLWPQYEHDFSAGLKNSPFLNQDEDVAVLSGIRRLTFESYAMDSYELAEAIEPAPESAFESSLSDSGSNSSFGENLIQRLVGNLLHYALMEIAQGQPRTSDETIADWTRQLRLSGLDQKSQTEALTRLEGAYSNATQSEFGQWVLNPEHQESACELEIEQLLADGSLARSIIDRTFLESVETGESNIRWIIDYKSATPADGQSEADFLALQENKYRNQLAQYRSLFSGEKSGDNVSDNTVKTLLYFPAANLHHEVLPQ